jgi:hypothetical protein
LNCWGHVGSSWPQLTETVHGSMVTNGQSGNER